MKVGNGKVGGDANTVYFTAGIFGESHGLFGSLATAAPGSPEGPAEAQWVKANLDLVQLDFDQDAQTFAADSRQIAAVNRAFAADTVKDANP